MEWLTPAVRALLALALVVLAQAAAPATVRGLCGVLPVVVQPVEPGAQSRLFGSNLSGRATVYIGR